MAAESKTKTEPAIEPPDGGWGWVIVACVFSIGFLSFGSMYSIGIIFDLLMAEFGCSKSEVSLMASINFSLQCFLAPIVSMLHDRFGTRIVVFVAALIVSISFILSAFAPNIFYLYVVFGVLGGAGSALGYLPVMVIISYYFKKRRSLATALGGIGAYTGCFVHPYLFKFLISNYGWRGALFVMGAIVLNSLPASILLRPVSLSKAKSDKKLPISVGDEATHSVESPDQIIMTLEVEAEKETNKTGLARLTSLLRPLFDILKNPELTAFIMSNFLICMAFYTPSLFIVDWGTQLGIKPEGTTLLLSLVGIGNITGRPVMAFLGDLLASYRALIFTIIVALTGIITAITPLFANFQFLVFFVFQFSFFTGGSSTLITPILADMVPLNRLGFAFGLHLAAQGVAMLIGPPILVLFPTYALTFTIAGFILVISAVLFGVLAYASRLFCMCHFVKTAEESAERRANAAKTSSE